MAGRHEPDDDRQTPSTPCVDITPRRDGPLVVTGPITLTAADGTTEEHTGRTFLCRCGRSAIKPLCDGTHKRTDFQAPGVVPPRKPEA